MKFSKTRDLISAWRDAGANPGKGADVFNETLGGATQKPAPPPKAVPNKHGVSSELAAKLERLRGLDPEAAAQIDDLLSSGTVRKDSDE